MAVHMEQRQTMTEQSLAPDRDPLGWGRGPGPKAARGAHSANREGTYNPDVLC